MIAGAAAFVVWKILPDENAAVTLKVASGVWLEVSILVWRLRKSHIGR